MTSATKQKQTGKMKPSMRSPFGGIATSHQAAGWHAGTDFEEGLRIVARAGVSRRTRSRGLA